MISPASDQIVERYIRVDGLNIRYLECGDGAPALLMHGASLGSSADVFRRNLVPLSAGGVRAIAFDNPGYGLSDNPSDWSVAFRQNMVPKFMDAIGLKKAALIAHSQAGGMAVSLVLDDPSRYSHLLVAGTGGLLPPLENAKKSRVATLQARVDRMAAAEAPTLESTRRQLESVTFHTELVTDEEVALRHQRSIGKNFEAHKKRTDLGIDVPGVAPNTTSTPMWRRLAEIRIPFVYMVGREDRANARERAELLKQRCPELNIHIIDGCKHMVPWDAAAEMVDLAISLITKTPQTEAAEQAV